jgi:glycolate oxidase
MEKNELMSEMFSPDSIAAIRGLKNLFDPDGFFNPGKLLPTGRGCVESRGTVAQASACRVGSPADAWRPPA